MNSNPAILRLIVLRTAGSGAGSYGFRVQKRFIPIYAELTQWLSGSHTWQRVDSVGYILVHTLVWATR